MTEPTPAPAEVTAGSLLKAARQAQGLHIGVLAANLKVPQARLEALEADRHDQMPDATFVRALAQSVCRALKVDALPILALLPSAGARGLERVDGGLNAPFRERPGRTDPIEAGLWRQPLTWLVALLLLGALAFALWPRAGMGFDLVKVFGRSAPGPMAPVSVETGAAATGATTGSSAPGTLPKANGSAAGPAVSPAAASAPTATTAATATGGPLVELLAVATTWVEVTDADGRIVLSRHLQPGEAASTQGKPPLKVVVGNAQGTRLQFAGRPVDLGPATRDNVARLELNLP